MTAAPGSDEIVDRLRRLDSAAVSDALDALGLEGAVSGISPRWACPPVAGRVVPVRVVPVGEAEPPTHHLGTAAIDGAEPGSVLVVDNAGRTEMGAWGGLLSRAALRRGMAGAVVYGACRDVDEARALGFPVFAAAATPRTARGRVVEAPEAALSVGGVVVRRGDLVLADSSGVVFVGQRAATSVLERAEATATREAAIAQALDRGRPAVEAMGASYEQMLRTTGDGEPAR